jgi:hypothetical protein
MRLDTSGNAFLGATSGVGGVRLTVVGGGTQLSPGTTAQEGVRIQRATGYATFTGINNDNNAYNGLQFFTSASAAATIDTSGNVGIGTASPGTKLDVVVSTNNGLRISDGAVTGVVYASSGPAMVVGTTSNHPTVLYSNNAERMRIDGATGNVGIGGTAEAYSRLNLLGTYPTSSNATQVVRLSGTIPSGTTASYRSFLSRPVTQATAFTLTNLIHFEADPQTLGAGSAVTNQYGFSVADSLTGATNNYGFYSNIASGSNRYNFFANGTANNYFAGAVGIGALAGGAIGDEKLRVRGTDADSFVVTWEDSTGDRLGGLYANATVVGVGSVSSVPLIFQTNQVERMRITTAGNIVAGASAALATTATDGFLYVPTCAGTPTGTPTAITGMAPIVVNTTNNKLYFYSGGQWRDAGP